MLQEHSIMEVIGVVSSVLIGLYMKNSLTDELFTISRNWLTLGEGVPSGSPRTQMSKWQYTEKSWLMHPGPMASIGSNLWNGVPSLFVWLASFHPADVSLNVIFSETASGTIKSRCSCPHYALVQSPVYFIHNICIFGYLSITHLCSSWVQDHTCCLTHCWTAGPGTGTCP